MQKQLIEDMIYDLNIESYPGEVESQYHARIIYSAMSLWMKHIILDQTIEEDKHEVKSKKYHYRRSAEIFEEFISLFPSIESWMYPDKKINPLHQIRNDLIASGEINEVNVNGDIGLGRPQRIPISSDISRVIGLYDDKESSKYTGVTKICIGYNDEKSSSLSQDSTAVIEDFLNPSYYSEQLDLKFDYELFKVHKAGKYNKRWEENGRLDSELNLIRVKTPHENFWNYALLLNHSGKVYKYSLHEELINIGFHSQLMIGLKKIYGSAAEANFIHKDNIIELNLDIKLPRYEEMIIRTYSWPKNNIVDSWSYIIPIEVWSMVKKLLITLGYIVKGE